MKNVHLLVELLCGRAEAGFPDLSQPLGAMAGIVDVPARTGNRPAAIQRFQAIHDSRQIFDDGQVAPGEFSQVPSSKVTDKVPRSPAKNSRMVKAFVSRMDSITTLPLESITATEMVA